MPPVLQDLLQPLLGHLPPELLNARLAAAAAGALLLVLGARIYRIAIVAPGFVIGVLAVVTASEQFAPGVMSSTGLTVAALSLGVVGGAICHLLERVAVASVGGLLAAGLAKAFAPLVLGAAMPWYVPVAAALLGLLLFPRFYRALLPVLTPIAGALSIAWAFERSGDIPFIAGLAAVGIIVQLLITRGGKRKGD